MKKSFSSGFTLIELLVVIAIIALLSSVVLAALNSARTNAGDANVRANMNTIIKQANVVFFDNSGSYSTVCADATIRKAISSAASASGGSWTAPPFTRDYNCTNAAGTWVVVLKLKSAGWLCVDNTVGVPEYNAAQPALIISTCP